MASPDPTETHNDIFPRDEAEHFKLELTRLRSENERLTGEVDYLRQALAAALSKIPQLDAPATDNASPATEGETAPPRGNWPWENPAAFRPYARYLPAASLMGPPVILLTLLALTLTCSLVLVGMYLLSTL